MDQCWNQILWLSFICSTDLALNICSTEVVSFHIDRLGSKLHLCMQSNSWIILYIKLAAYNFLTLVCHLPCLQLTSPTCASLRSATCFRITNNERVFTSKQAALWLQQRAGCLTAWGRGGLGHTKVESVKSIRAHIWNKINSIPQRFNFQLLGSALC